MGGKGRKRREKNYRAAHGGHSRLPPPPDRSQIEALPSKLRQLISLTSKVSTDQQKKKKNNKGGDVDTEKKPARSREKVDPETTRARDEGDDEQMTMPQDGVRDEGDDEHMTMPHDGDSEDATSMDSKIEKRKRKRKRKPVDDLRFVKELETSGSRLKKRERRKKFLEAKKKKHKKSTTEDSLDFPGREKIRFGEVAEAPPKLVAVPKAFKNAQNASQERLRLQAIEAYRNRKGWTSRPWIQLPPPVTM